MNIRPSFSYFGNHLVLVAADGKLYAWGSSSNVLGVGETPGGHGIPRLVQLPPELCADDFLDFAASDHNLLLTRDSKIYAWGKNDSGQLGLGDLGERDTPCLVDFPNDPTDDQKTQKISRIFCGAYNSAALTDTGLVYMWGTNSSGQIGITGGDSQFSSPVLVPLPSPIVSLTTGWAFVLALDASGILWGWGDNATFQLGISPPSNIFTPTQSPISGLTEVYSGSNHCFGRKKDGTIVAWGWNEKGQCGIDSEKLDLSIPEKFIAPKKIVHLAGGGSFTLALLEDGNLIGCGKNNSGELAAGDYNHKRSPVPVIFPEDEIISCFAGGFDFSWVITKEGNLYIWGSTSDQKLGPGLPQAASSWHTKKDFTPILYPGWKFRSSKWEEIWKKNLRWQFLGKRDEGSIFFHVPIEILFHSVLMYQ